MLNPHMSVFYGSLCVSERKDITDIVLPMLPDKFVFDAIWAVSNQEGVVGVTDSSHVAGWQLAAATQWSDFSF